MNNLNADYQQQLRQKFFKWLIRIRNSTLMQSTLDSTSNQKQQQQQRKSQSDQTEFRHLVSSHYSTVMHNNSFNLNHSNSYDNFGELASENFFNETNNNSIHIGQTTVKMFQENATRFFESKNLSINDLNITSDNLNDFVKKLLQLSKPLNDSDIVFESHPTDPCNYCNGFIKDASSSYKKVHGYISLVVCIFGTIANILNIIVLTRKDMNKTPINTILKWLAVADMFVMIEYIPFTIYMYIFPGRLDFNYSWAVYLLFHMHFTQILHTISISLTVILALWRYIAIKHPHGKLASCVLSHCGSAILLSFVLSPILCFPTYFVFRISEVYLYKNRTEMVYHVNPKEDTFLYSFNFWVHSVIIKLLPCLVLTVISFVLIRVLCQAAKRKVKLKGYNQAASATNVNTVLNGHRPSKCQRRTDRTTMLLVAVLLLFLITEFPQGILGLMSGILEKCFFTQCYNRFGEMMDLLALINAAVGFVLYGLMSKQFRTSFKAVFFNTRLSRLEMTRITNLNNTTCV